jgi:putative transposase
MARQKHPMAIARWRYDLIEQALGERHHARRGVMVKRASSAPVQWPSGEVRPVSAATLYRWISAYERGGLPSLCPARRKDRGKKRARLDDAVVKKALALWADDPETTLTMLIALLRAHAELDLDGRGITIARSTLARRLAGDPLYARLRRAHKRSVKRGRFVARRPHDIWQLDAKGPTPVVFVSGEKLAFHVLTVIDDASRAVLAAIVVKTPDLCAAVRVFRQAAKRWGLPFRLYCDRASIFDSRAFRDGLAVLGSHRIWTRAHNAPAHGKVEAYHRTLDLWYFRPLKKQRVVDLTHLQELLDGVLERVYQDHRHRGLKASPRSILAARVSERAVTAERLHDAFRREVLLQAHRTTGEVDIAGVTYLVPEALRGRKLRFRIDPDPLVPPLVVDPESEHELPLVLARIHPDDAAPNKPERWGEGPLQKLYDAWQGKVRPIAEPGFGLPEMLELLAAATGRPVPRSDAEAALVQRLWRDIGPLPKRATSLALTEIVRELGHGRPLRAYLEALARRLPPPPTRRKSS